MDENINLNKDQILKLLQIASNTSKLGDQSGQIDVSELMKTLNADINDKDSGGRESFLHGNYVPEKLPGSSLGVAKLISSQQTYTRVHSSVSQSFLHSSQSHSKENHSGHDCYQSHPQENQRPQEYHQSLQGGNRSPKEIHQSHRKESHTSQEVYEHHEEDTFNTNVSKFKSSFGKDFLNKVTNHNEGEKGEETGKKGKAFNNAVDQISRHTSHEKDITEQKNNVVNELKEKIVHQNELNEIFTSTSSEILNCRTKFLEDTLNQIKSHSTDIMQQEKPKIGIKPSWTSPQVLNDASSRNVSNTKQFARDNTLEKMNQITVNELKQQFDNEESKGERQNFSQHNKHLVVSELKNHFDKGQDAPTHENTGNKFARKETNQMSSEAKQTNSTLRKSDSATNVFKSNLGDSKVAGNSHTNIRARAAKPNIPGSDPNVRKLVYSQYREMLKSYSNGVQKSSSSRD